MRTEPFIWWQQLPCTHMAGHITDCTTVVWMTQYMGWQTSKHLRRRRDPDSKVHGANMGPTWVLSAPDGPHVGPMNLAMNLALAVNIALIDAVIGAIIIQSRTKPNLIAKTLATNFGNQLQKLVAKVSSQFHDLVNTGLNVGSLVKWLPIKIANTCKLDIVWVVYCLPIGIVSIKFFNAFNIVPSGILHPIMWSTSPNSLGLIL